MRGPNRTEDVTPERANERLVHAVNRIGPVWIAVVVLYAISAIVSPAMFQTSQVFNILQVAAFVGMIACGQTLVLLVGGIDLSQAGVVTLVNIVSTSIMMGHNTNIAAAVAVCLVLAIVTGLANAFFIVVIDTVFPILFLTFIL